MRYSFKHTLYACYTGYITQAIVNNLAPILFIVFQQQFGISFEQVGRLILINFGTQIAADLISVRYVDRIGYRKAAVLAHLLSVLGLVGLAVLPMLLPPYLGLTTAVIIYALGGGLLEVLVSPIVESLPGEQKESAMSLLHSFYCWGQVFVVLVSTLLLWVFGTQIWVYLPVMWAIVPLINMFLFSKVPLMPPLPKEHLMPLRELLNSKFFGAALILMMCAGASELTMSQWSSLFAEKGLHVSKVIGDLAGPCMFAVLMGIGRTLYGIWGHKINLKNALLASGALCILCYLVTIFSPSPILSLIGCAVCGFSVSLMWPGTFSLTAEKFPRGGTAMFGMLAVFGDLGAAIGPWMAGYISDVAQGSQYFMQIGTERQMDPAQLGLKSGLLVALIFPILLVAGVIYFQKAKHK
ncbi:MFS transporter [Hydrogenoanaerobacterium sp.]|uniref:MFS transporter n=1 Tax=Hydrogenoanaerobacterium sp. TaxID=2953763 RepID=UPI002897A256|nr:MFS transporter [Hydrogenoanaerobacterium sp.]